MRGRSEIEDSIAVSIRTWKPKVGSRTWIQHERLVSVPRRSILEELQSHGDLRGPWGRITEQWCCSATPAQSLRTVQKFRRGSLSGKPRITRAQGHSLLRGSD
jgi:hypothetical protein